MHKKDGGGQEEYDTNTNHYPGKYNINNDGPAQGLAIGDGTIVHMHFHNSRNEPESSPQSSGNTRDHSQVSLRHSKLRSKLLKTVRTDWIESYVKRPLEGVPLLILRLREEPRTRHSSKRLLPVGTRIEQVYDESSRQLLIQGDPDSGKTMLLLGLACNLLKYAEEDERAEIPIVLKLSTWRQNLSFAQWLMEELDTTTYHISDREVLHSWMQENQLIFLLDGLDEVPEKKRNDCIKAINEYQKEHGDIVPMVITSRLREISLRLSKIVAIEPLEDEQINEYIATANSTLHPVLDANPILRELATTPLMLNIMTKIYSNSSSAILKEIDDEKPLDQQIFEKYVEHRLDCSDIKKRYTPQQIRTWLTWIAKQIIRHPQPIFRLDQLDESQLSAPYTVIIAILQIFLLGSTAILFPTILLLSGLLVSPTPSLPLCIIAIFFVVILFVVNRCGKLALGSFGLVSLLVFLVIPIEAILSAFFRTLHNIISFLNISLSVIAIFHTILIILILFTFRDGKYHIKLQGLAKRLISWPILSSVLSHLSRLLQTVILISPIGLCIFYFILFYILPLLFKSLFVDISLSLCAGVILFVEIDCLIRRMKCLILLLFLWKERCCPWRYFDFLHSMVECSILCKSNQGFDFIHPPMCKYLSELDDPTNTSFSNNE